MADDAHAIRCGICGICGRTLSLTIMEIPTMAKVRFDYSLVGLAKKDGVTTFNGAPVESLPESAKTFLVNYGGFVALTRTLAGHEKDTAAEKKAHIQKEWDWLAAGCPKRERAIKSAYERAMEQYEITVKSIRDAAANGTKAEKKMADDIIAKIPKPVKPAEETETEE